MKHPMEAAPQVAELGYFEATCYGLIQGVTEFLPVSSSGHLKIAHRLGLGAIPPELEMPFDVLLHGATLIAIGIAFFPDIIAAIRKGINFYMVMAISIVPAGLAGLFGRSVVHSVGESYFGVGVCYVYTAILLYFAQVVSRRRTLVETNQLPDELLNSVTRKQAVYVGLFQVLALLPGVSRSGSTVAGGLLGGMSSALAVSYSFLVGLPLIAAAAAKDALDGGFSHLISVIGWGPILVAFVSSVISGLLSIALLKLVVGRNRLHWFSVYCMALAIACFVLEGLSKG
ncbi:MAG: undecaprenyl-diphosphate phosphatase [Myxococcota bacterium]|nr:undecaprenyl-diphosphate phosphatase [Myxococcota bacterium]